MSQKIQNYNIAFDELCFEFTKRFLESDWEEISHDDIVSSYRIIGDTKRPLAPYTVAINEERYFDIWDIRETVENDIPIEIVKKWYDLNIETEWNPWINLVNFWKTETIPPHEIMKEREKEIKESEKHLKDSLILFYRELGLSEEKAIKQFNEIIKR